MLAALPFHAALVLQASALGVIGSHEANADALLEPWRWRPFAELAGQEVRSVSEAPSGSVFFATRGGVWEYDGVSWRHHTIADLGGSPPHSVHAAQGGSVLVGTSRGVLELSGDEWIERFPGSGGPAFPVRDIVSDLDGRVWVAGPWGLLRLGPDPVLSTSQSLADGARYFFPELRVRVLPAHLTPARPWGTSTGLLLIPSMDGLVGGQAVPLLVASVVPGSPADIAGIQLGTALLPGVEGLSEWGLAALTATVAANQPVRVVRDARQPTNALLSVQPLTGSFTDFQLSDVHVTAQGSLWIGLEDGEVVSIPSGDSDPDEWRLFDETDGLSMGEDPTIASTLDGIVWAVSSSGQGGVSRFERGRWTAQRLSDVGGSDINTSISAAADGSIWIGGLGVLHRFRDDEWSVYEQPQISVPSTRVFVHASGPRLWLSGPGAETSAVDLGTERFERFPGLLYQGERRSGGRVERWFLSEDATVHVQTTDGWTVYGPESGLMTRPSMLLVELDEVWAGGGHNGIAATARFREGSWQLETHEELSWSVDRRALFRASDSSLWVGAAVDFIPERGQTGGMLQRVADAWVHHATPSSVYGITEDGSGRIWVGGTDGLFRFAGGLWEPVTMPWDSLSPRVDRVASDDTGAIWIGTRSAGVLRYDGEVWTRFGFDAGLPNETIRALVVASPKDAWALTTEGARRFDGVAWHPTALEWTFRPAAFNSVHVAANGSVWIGRLYPDPDALLEPSRFRPTHGAESLLIHPEGRAPDTRIEAPPARVARPGAITLRWSGTDPWMSTRPSLLTFSIRVDDRPWSPFNSTTSLNIRSLPSGEHVVSVRARDLDFNVDPTPAVASFTVTAPVWAQAWFQLLVGSLVALAGFQTLRAWDRGRRLHAANRDLEVRVADRTRELSEAYEDLKLETDEREAAEERLRRALKMEAVGRLAAGIAHDFNNLLTVVSGTSELLIDDHGDQPELRQDLEDIRGAASRAAGLTQQLLAFSRKQILMPELLDVSEVVESMHSILSRTIAIDVAFVTDVSDEPVMAWADRGGIEQILLNLVVNANQAIDRSGTITLRTSSVFLDEQAARALDPELVAGRYARLSVEDDGVGISEEVLKDLFEPFFTTKETGTGLGLATVWGVAKQSGGTARAESHVGAGTTMSIYLPCEAPELEPEKA